MVQYISIAFHLLHRCLFVRLFDLMYVVYIVNIEGYRYCAHKMSHVCAPCTRFPRVCAHVITEQNNIVKSKIKSSKRCNGLYKQLFTLDSLADTDLIIRIDI